MSGFSGRHSVQHEAAEVDLLADGDASLGRGDFATAVDRYSRAWRVRDRTKRAARAATVAQDDFAMAQDFRAMRKAEQRREAELLARLNVFIGLRSFPGFSLPVAVFGRWSGEYSPAAESLFIINCAELRPDGCWVWIGAHNRKREPVVSIGGPANVHAGVFGHRLFNGDTARGWEAYSECANASCVSLDHWRVRRRLKPYDGSEGTTPGA